MGPPAVSKADTSYPIFAATFDPNHHLIVGGGGGAGRSGVGNKITVFDVSSRAPAIEPSAEIELSRDEDSVTCLANLTTKDGAILYAGINSSEEERLKDRNHHFRSFEASFAKGSRRVSGAGERKSQGKISYVSKTGLFSPPTSTSGKKEAYQRLVRLSPFRRSASGNKRIGAIASSLAGDENEIVVFNATSTRPQDPADIISRIPLSRNQEANDLDILEPDEGRFQVAYCLDHDVFVQDIQYDFGKRKVQGRLLSPEKKYTVPFPDVFEKKGRFKIRCIRWLSPFHVLLLANLPNRTGVDLQILRMYDDTMGSIILRKRLPGHVKAAVDMDVAILDADSEGSYQVVVAVGAIDISLSIYTIDYNGVSKSLSSFHSLATYREVHPLQMTKVVFSPFFSPWVSAQASPGKKPGPQYLHLASTSLGNSISVETFTLEPISSKPRARYVLITSTSRTIYKTATFFVAAFVVLVLALLVQSMIYPEGSLTRGLMPQNVRGAAGNADSSALADMAPESAKAHRIRDIVHLHRENTHKDLPPKALVIHDDPDTDSSLSTEVHADTDEVVKRHTEAKTWDDLSHTEQKKWKQKLVDAGMWAVDEGETILKGIFFSEMGGIVGQMAQGIMNG
ncbi:hypothetical protein EJ04DRAFT_460039 [Polyplosphaeria fusca]|uniref:Guanine nucleotide-exchange factor SEC12 n=1 Tax=Polyplosphaeria fusca TaxID=682080 RepID=A0A9P4R4V8_9PLEO|nr:hypothetical protein EJ04DRAFT_460039 [Polyplosphaeria fusca]